MKFVCSLLIAATWILTTLSVSVAQNDDNAADASTPPNVVFVFADQLRADLLGCYGGTEVGTPHLDQMADEGTLFTNAVSTWPVCSPFRAMLLTGLQPMRNGTVSNDTALRDDVTTMGEIFQDQGYATGYIGKWHLEWSRTPFIPPERRRGFEYWAAFNCSHQHLNASYFTDENEPIRFEKYEPEGQVDLAIDFIDRHRDGPFCLVMSWGPPHDPYKAPDEYMDLFPPENIQLGANFHEHDIVDELIATDPIPPGGAAVQARAKRRASRLPEPIHRQRMQGYLAATRALDDCMGRLLDAIDQRGLGENTIVVFTSDHGDMIGSHTMESKQCPLEESIGIPFLVRYPDAIPTGVETDALLGPTDMLPTLLGLAGLDRPESVAFDGLDLQEAALGGASDHRDAILIMKMTEGGNPYALNALRPWRGVKTKRYTYARRLDLGPWLLFDNEADPHQLNNLIDDPSYTDLVTEMETTLDRLLEEAGDPCDTAAIDEYRQRRKDGELP
jgi:arylsulfatase A-like enzyme